jgi:hypothetical protein
MHKKQANLWVSTLALVVFFQILCVGVSSALPALQGGEIFGCGLNAGASSFSELGAVQPGGTGNNSLDAGIQIDILELQKVFGVSAKMFLLQEANGPNAFALSQPVPQVLGQFRIPAQASPDGMVFFGLGLMKSEYGSEFGTGYAIPSIIGHEYAHILQYKLGFPLRGKWQELHADYLAGWYTAHRSRYVPQNIAESMLSFFKKGDLDFNSPGHHGTPQERQEAFVAGLNLNLRNNVSSGRAAYDQGIVYLQQRGAR